MEEMTLSDKTVEQIANRTANILFVRLKSEADAQKELVSVKEAAQILGISVNHMRSIKDDYKYIRRGGKYSGNIFFVRESLMAAPERQKHNKQNK